MHFKCNSSKYNGLLTFIRFSDTFYLIPLICSHVCRLPPFKGPPKISYEDFAVFLHSKVAARSIVRCMYTHIITKIK